MHCLDMHTPTDRQMHMHTCMHTHTRPPTLTLTLFLHITKCPLGEPLGTVPSAQKASLCSMIEKGKGINHAVQGSTTKLRSQDK